jgi:hypothetical protein
MPNLSATAKSISSLILLSTMLAFPAFADDEESSFIMDTSSIGQSNNGVVSSDQFLELGQPSPNALRMEGEAALRLGHLDRAIMVFQRSVEMAPLDMDSRVNYADALEKKLVSQKVRDPKLYNYIIKQWLFVVKKADFPDQIMQARSHLYSLTGLAPSGRMGSSAKRYLAKVLIPEDGSVKVVLGGHAMQKQAQKIAEKKKDGDE